MIIDEKQQIILIVDDTPANLDIMRAFLKEHNFKILVANCGEAALKRIQYIHPDLILLDVMMPGMDGFETCRKIKEKMDMKEIPVIFMTALTETEHKTLGFSAGAVDYVTKPVQKEELLARITAHLEIKKYRDHLEEEVLKRTLELENINKKLKKEIEERIKSGEEYRLLFNNANDAIFIFKEGICVNCNIKALELFHCRKENIIGQSPFFFFTPETQPNGIQSKDLLLEMIKNKSEIFEMQLLREGNDAFDAEIHLNELKIGTEEYLQAIIRDISQRKQLQKMEAALIQSSKMAEIGALTAAIVHEIRNPIAGIEQTIQNIENRLIDESNKQNESAAKESGFTISVLKKYLNSRRIDSMISDLNHSCKRVCEIINNMLPYSRKTMSEMEEYDIHQLMGETLYLAKFNTEFINISNIEISYEDNLPPIYCSKNEIQQVILNILTNGAQAMSEHRKIAADFYPSFFIKLYTRDSFFCIEIENNGPGIEEEFKEKIFDPFFSTKPAGKGTGLGLFICRQIVEEKHKGVLLLDNKQDQGVVVIIKLPLR